MSHKHGMRWEFVVGKVLKGWATSIMQEGHTRAEARQMILEELRLKTAPPDAYRIRIPKFVRKPFLWGWTIGWDWTNSAILQFTKTIPYKDGYTNVGLFFLRYSYSSRTWEAKEGRYFLNIGWDV